MIVIQARMVTGCHVHQALFVVILSGFQLTQENYSDYNYYII
jgi:hypothetical protein